MDNIVEWQFKVTGNAPQQLNQMQQSAQNLTAPLYGIIGVLNKISTQMDKLFVAMNFGIARNAKGFNDLNSQLFRMRVTGDRTEDILRKGMDGLSAATDKANHKVEQLSGNLKKTEGGGSLLTKLSAMGQAFIGIKAIAAEVGGMFQPIFQEGMARETAGVQFGTLLKSEGKDGKAYAEELRNTDAAALYGTGTINQAAMKMISFGFDSNTTLKTLNQLGDIAMGDKGKLDSMATAFGQITSAGKMMTEDFNQLRDAGFNPLKVISDATGESMTSLREKMEKGQISAQMVAKSLEMATTNGGKFEGMLKNVMDNTTQGKMAKLQGMFDNLKAKLFEMLLPITEKVMPVITDTLIPAIGSILDALSPVFTFLADNIDTVLTFTGVLGGLAAVMAVVNAVMAANPVSIVIMAIAALVTWVVHLVKTFDEWKDSCYVLFSPLHGLISIIMTIKDYWASIVDAFQSDGIIGGLKRIGICILDLLLQPVQQLLGWIGELTDWEWAKGAADTISAMRKGMEAPNALARKKQEDKEKAIAAAAATAGTPFGGGTQKSVEAAVNSAAGGGAAISAATDQGKNAVASGGTRNTQITINLGNLVENIKFEGGVQENKESLRSQVLEELLRVLYSAQTAV